MKLNKVNLQQVFLFLTYVLAIFPILSFALRSIVMIVWSIIGLCVWGVNHFGKPKKYTFKTPYKKYFFFFILPYLSLVFSLLYSENWESGLSKLVQMLAFLVIPLVFYLNRELFKNKEIKMIIRVFCASVIIFVLYQIFWSLLNLDYLLGDLTKREIEINNLSDIGAISIEKSNEIKVRRFRNFILDLVDSHFTYQGLWISFAFFVLVKEAYEMFQVNKIRSVVLLIFSCILITWLLFISARMPFFSIMVVCFITAIFFYNIKLKMYLVLLGVGLFISISGYFLITPIKVRVDELITTKFNLPTTGKDIQNYNSVNVRNGIYYCAYDVSKKYFLTGVGIGDAQEILNLCYQNKIKAQIYTWRNYNTHNEYFNFMVCTGVFGLFAYLYSIFIQLKISIQSKHIVQFYFVSIIILISLTENILSRSDGVMFYAFFGSLFLFNQKNKE